jgi:hypothetical protein
MNWNASSHGLRIIITQLEWIPKTVGTAEVMTAQFVLQVSAFSFDIITNRAAHSKFIKDKSYG